MSKVLALVDDLMFQSKILETARHTGAEVKIVGTADALLAEAQAESPALVLVDLNARAAPMEAIERLRAAGSTVPVVGFLSHVQADLAERARAAGCSEVMPRSKFTQQLAAVLTRANSSAQQA
ncbi:MAG: response regulator [Candidatus Acidiferrales bacterium]